MHKILPTAIASAAASLAIAVLLPDAARSDTSAGEQAFTACAACHSTDGNSETGPTLKGIVGRSSASIPGFPYSSAMKRANLKWTPEVLDRYIANPQAVVPGNVMPYAGLPDQQQRAALVEYLATLK